MKSFSNCEDEIMDEMQSKEQKITLTKDPKNVNALINTFLQSQSQKPKQKENSILKENDITYKTYYDSITSALAEQNASIKENEYKCNQCGQIYIENDDKYKNGRIKAYMTQYVCNNCTKKGELERKGIIGIKKKRQLIKHTSLLRCIEPQCKEYGHIYYGKAAYTRWKTHYNKYHYNNKQYLSITHQHQCENEECKNIIEQSNKYCKEHQKEEEMKQSILTTKSVTIPKQSVMENSILGSIKQNTQYILDASKAQFNINNIYNNIDISYPIYNNKQKDNIIKILIKNVEDITHAYTDPDRAINGAIAIKSWAPTFHYVPYKKENYIYNQQQKNIRIQYYHQKKWNLLWDNILAEQNKRNAKRERQKGHKKYGNGGGKAIIKKQAPSINIDLNKLHQQIDDIKCNEMETVKEWKYKLNRSVRYCQEGKFKKANQILDTTHICNLEIHGNYRKLLSKLPNADTTRITKEDYKNNVKYQISEPDTINIVKTINPQSIGGLFGIENSIIVYGLNTEPQLGTVLYKLIKLVIEKGLPSIVRDILILSKGIPIGKEKNGIPDYDIRPIIVTDGLIRIIDKCALANVKKELREELYGPYQSINVNNALEIANAALDNALEIQKKYNEMAIVNMDAQNAYNSMSRNKLWEMIKKYCPALRNFFKFLYGRPILAIFSEKRICKVEEGLIQGLTTSSFLYSSGKHLCCEKTHKQLQHNFGYKNINVNNEYDSSIKSIKGSKEEEKQNNENQIIIPKLDLSKIKYIENKINDSIYNEDNCYELIYSNHYIDDGVDMMHIRYVPMFIKLMIINYKEWNIKINVSKSLIILYKPKRKYIKYIKSIIMDIKITEKQEFKYLGVFKGTEEYINDNLNEYIRKKFRKLLAITMISNQQIKKHIMYEIFRI